MIASMIAAVAVLFAAQAVQAPRFVPEHTTAVVTDGVVVVTFEEVDLPAAQTVDVDVVVDARSTAECRPDDPAAKPLFTSTSSASARQGASHVASPAGRISASVRLVAQPGSVEVSGLDCTMAFRREISVVLHDRTNDVRYVLPDLHVAP